MWEELKALDRTHTWYLVSLPLNEKITGCNWVYNIMIKANRSLKYYTAHLVPKNFSQEYDINYEERFAPIAKITSARVFIALSSSNQCPLFKWM